MSRDIYICFHGFVWVVPVLFFEPCSGERMIQDGWLRVRWQIFCTSAISQIHSSWYLGFDKKNNRVLSGAGDFPNLP